MAKLSVARLVVGRTGIDGCVQICLDAIMIAATREATEDAIAGSQRRLRYINTGLPAMQSEHQGGERGMVIVGEP